MTTILRLLRDDGGQDLIEYALLTATIGFAGMVALQTLSANINTTYRAWDIAVNAVWEVPDPQ
jgi:Flp pilus assembly pilin Flp